MSGFDVDKKNLQSGMSVISVMSDGSDEREGWKESLCSWKIKWLGKLANSRSFTLALILNLQ